MKLRLVGQQGGGGYTENSREPYDELIQIRDLVVARRRGQLKSERGGHGWVSSRHGGSEEERVGSRCAAGSSTPPSSGKGPQRISDPFPPSVVDSVRAE